MGKAAKRKLQRKGVRQRIIELYGKISPPILKHNFSADCCLNGTWVAIEALSKFDIVAHPVVTKTMVYNKVWWERMIAKGDFPTESESDEWAAAGGWSIGCAGPVGAEQMVGWPYHLVAVTNGVIIDSSSGQFNRVGKGIKFKQVLVHPSTDEFSSGTKPLILEGDQGEIIWYQREDGIGLQKDGLKGFSDSPWNVRVAAEISKKMKEQVKNW